METDRLQVGMFVHALDGSWFSNPFWRRRFLIEEDSDIAALRDAAIAFAIIDTDRGIAPTDETPAAEAAPDAQQSAWTEPPAPARRSASADREHAQLVISRSKEAMRGVFDRARLGTAVNAADIEAVVDDISEAMVRNHKALTGLLRLKSKDEYTYMHSVAVCALMIGLARHMHINEMQVRELGMAGLLHDIGKLTIPEDILNKPGSLSEEEFAQVLTHPMRGAELIQQGQGIPAVAIEVCRHHHEKFDGTGYPDRLAGEAITLPARMGAICDVYDALTSDRSYKQAWSPLDALGAMYGWKGQFDPAVLVAFFRSLAMWPAGMLARTDSGMLGVVLPPKPRQMLARLRLFYDLDRAQIVDPFDVTLSAVGGEHDISCPEDPDDWGVPDWEQFADYLLARGDSADLATLRYLWMRRSTSELTENIDVQAPDISPRPWQPVQIAKS